MRDDQVGRIEAALFVAGDPLGSRRLAQLCGLADATEARTLIHRLNRLYEAEGTAFRVEEIGGGYRLLTRPRLGTWLRRLHRWPVESRLSAPALETLAVVAYRQPVMRSEIEAIRGVVCGEMLRQLMVRDVVKIVGRSPELGRPFLYGTTKRFLELFGLKELDDLPRAAQLRAREASNPQAVVARDPAGRAGENNTPIFERDEEPQVKRIETLEPAPEELLNRRAVGLLEDDRLVAEDQDDDLEDDEDDEEDDDDDEEDDDLEDDEWEEVDDEEDDLDEDEDEDDEDWDDDDEDDDEWDDDEEEDEKEEAAE